MKFTVHFPALLGAPLHEYPGYQAVLSLCQQLGAQLPRRPANAGGNAYLSDTMVRYGTPNPEAFDGGVLILPNLSPLGTILVPLIKGLAQRGVTTYAASIGATPLLGMLPAIEATAEVFVPLVRENADLRREVKTTAQHWQDLYNQSAHGALLHAVQNAVPALIAKLPVLGEVAQKGEATPKHIGEVIRHERERQSLSITALGQMAGVQQASLSRLESGEVTTGPTRDAVMKTLFLDRARVVERQFTEAHVLDHHGIPRSAADIIS